jgi:hypothetical protein
VRTFNFHQPAIIGWTWLGTWLALNKYYLTLRNIFLLKCRIYDIVGKGLDWGRNSSSVTALGRPNLRTKGESSFIC